MASTHEHLISIENKLNTLSRESEIIQEQAEFKARLVNIEKKVDELIAARNDQTKINEIASTMKTELDATQKAVEDSKPTS